MFGEVKAWFATNLLVIAAIALAASLVWGGAQTARLWWAQSSLATEKADRAAENLSRERAAELARAKQVEIERAHAASEQELIEKHQQELQAERARADTADQLAQRLQHSVEILTATSNKPIDVAGASCEYYQHRASVLGNLYIGTDRLAGKLAKAAEQHLAEARLFRQQMNIDRQACNAPLQ